MALPLLAGCGVRFELGEDAPSSSPSASASPSVPPDVADLFPDEYAVLQRFQTDDFDVWVPSKPMKETYSYKNGNTTDVYSSWSDGFWLIVEHNLPAGTTMAEIADDYARGNDDAHGVHLVEGLNTTVDGLPGYSARYEEVIDDMTHTDEFTVVQDGSAMFIVETLNAGRGYGANQLRIAISHSADVHLTDSASGAGRT